MITIVKDMAFSNGRHVYEFRGLSTDSKPVGSINGSKFKELDTGITWWYNEDTELWIAESSKYLVKIEVDTPPTTTEYTVGETFDDTGMVIEATYTDGTTADIANYDYLPAGALALGDDKIEIIYIENGVKRTTTQSITVTEAE